jgi:hypothetical protein
MGQVHPTPLSRKYSLKLDYRPPHRPLVTVPEVKVGVEDQSLPHVYPGNELCLYYEGEFDGRRDLLADTIVPWACDWLYYYEIWLTTGEWEGGGIHPE